MTRRRTFLRWSGAATVGGMLSLAGCNQQAPTNNETTATTTTGGGTQTDNETQTTDSQENKTIGRFLLSGTTVLDDFEDMSGWEAKQGEMKEASPTAFIGSKSMRLTAEAPDSGDAAAWASKKVDWDLSGKTLSLAVKPTSPVDNLLVIVNLYAPDGENVHTMGELLRVRKHQGWMRLDLATRDFSGSPDLSSVKRVEIGVRAASGAIDFHFDDLRSVPSPDKGSVVLTFDDGLKSHYTEAFPRLREYDMAGSAGIITSQVGADGSATEQELKEMQDGGWNIVNHSTKNEKLTQVSKQEMMIAINDSTDWLSSKGFDSGAESFIYPHGAFDDRLIDVVSGKHSAAYRYMDPLSSASGTITDPFTITRGNAAYNLNLSKIMVNYAEQFNHNVVLTFHAITDDGGAMAMPPGQFNDLLDYISRRDVQIITLSDLQKNHLAN